MAQQAFGAMSAVQIQEGLKAKDFSAAEVARGALDGIAAADGQVHSFLQVTEDLALEAAARVDDALAAGTFDAPWPACRWASRTT